MTNTALAGTTKGVGKKQLMRDSSFTWPPIVSLGELIYVRSKMRVSMLTNLYNGAVAIDRWPTVAALMLPSISFSGMETAL